jgi:hypothetical protein
LKNGLWHWIQTKIPKSQLLQLISKLPIAQGIPTGSQNIVLDIDPESQDHIDQNGRPHG